MNPEIIRYPHTQIRQLLTQKKGQLYHLGEAIATEESQLPANAPWLGKVKGMHTELTGAVEALEWVLRLLA